MFAILTFTHMVCWFVDVELGYWAKALLGSGKNKGMEGNYSKYTVSGSDWIEDVHILFLPACSYFALFEFTFLQSLMLSQW